MVTTSVSRTSTLASSQKSSSWSVIRSLITSSRIVLTSCSEYRDEFCDENRFDRGIEFNCIFDSHPEGRFEYGFKCVFKCVYTRNEKAASEFWEISPESTTAIVRGSACRWSTPVLPWISQMQVPTTLCSTHNEQSQGRQPRRNSSNFGKR